MLNFNCFSAHSHASTAAYQKMQSSDEAEARIALSCGDSDKICEVDNYFFSSLFEIAIKLLQSDTIDE